MIRDEIIIERYDWHVYVYMAASKDDAPEIIGVLDSIGISAAEFMRAERHLQRAFRDSGMTYSSGRTRESVVVISQSSSPEQTINTFAHELRHLADDIVKALHVPGSGEEVAYLTGDVACALAGSLLHIACECPKCRNAG